MSDQTVRVRTDNGLGCLSVVFLVFVVLAAFRACGDDATFGEALGELTGEAVTEFRTGYERGRAPTPDSGR